jgi:hypothetical protein
MNQLIEMRPGYEELEEDAVSMILGKIVLSYSALEFNISLCLRALIAGIDVNLVESRIEGLSFKDKLSNLLREIEKRFSLNEECLCAFRAWHKDVDKLRIRRNSFIYRRWENMASTGTVVDVSPDMPGIEFLNKGCGTIQTLKEELAIIKDVSRSLERLRAKWHLY